jgi:hypothetical protein
MGKVRGEFLRPPSAEFLTAVQRVSNPIEPGQLRVPGVTPKPWEPRILKLVRVRDQRLAIALGNTTYFSTSRRSLIPVKLEGADAARADFLEANSGVPPVLVSIPRPQQPPRIHPRWKQRPQVRNVLRKEATKPFSAQGESGLINGPAELARQSLALGFSNRADIKRTNNAPSTLCPFDPLL